MFSSDVFHLSYQVLGTGTFALCGALSGAAASIITNPMDIAKLRLQVRILPKKFNTFVESAFVLGIKHVLFPVLKNNCFLCFAFGTRLLFCFSFFPPFVLLQVQRRGAGLSFGYRNMFHGMSLIHAAGTLLVG